MQYDTIGVDVSKDTLDVYRLGNGQRKQFPNTASGHKALVAWMGTAVERVVFEPTGSYHRAFEQALARAEVPMVKVNPRHARRFADATGQLAKTDSLDAILLARMGAMLQLSPRPAPEEKLVDLRELTVARASLIKDRTAAKNRAAMLTNPLLKQQNADRLQHIESQLAALDAELMAKIKGDPDLADRLKILASIPGIGHLTACILIVEMPELGAMESAHAASLAGLAPITRQSGTWKGKSFIQGGRQAVRKALFMPALVAARHNPDFKAKYNALIEAGKPPKVALVAIMRKIIVLANALLKAGRHWMPKSA